MLRLKTLGTPLVEGNLGPIGGAAAQPKPLALLALLASAGVRGMRRDKLLAYLWPETGAERASHRLNQLLHTLRRDLKLDQLFLGTGDLRLNADLIGADLVDFEAALGRGDPEQAVTLYGGPFLDGFHLSRAAEFEEWADEVRTECAARYAGALEALAIAAAQAGATKHAADYWRRVAQVDPLDTRVALRYVEALVGAGDRVQALQVARLHETMLREQLGIEPDPALAAMVRQLRSHEASPVAAAGAPRLPGETVLPPGAANHPKPVAPAVDHHSVAVLPFVNLSAAPESEYFSDGMTEELTNALVGVPELRVAARTSAFSFKGKQLDAREIGQRLNVRHLVEGSVRRAGDHIRITAQLVDAADGYHLWSTTYDRTLTDIFTVQDELARAIAGALTRTVIGSTGQPLVKPPTTTVEAYALYLKGLYCWHKRTTEGWLAGIDYFQRAVDLDPGYAAANVGLSYCYAMAGFDEFGALPPHVAMPKARAAVLKARELDPESADVHISLGTIALLYDWDWATTEREFDEGRHRGSMISYPWYSLFLSAMGRHDESIKAAESALAHDPLAVTLHA
jgi:TolB-like protein/DNA-binding SARP family transcriptional activator